MYDLLSTCCVHWTTPWHAYRLLADAYTECWALRRCSPLIAQAELPALQGALSGMT